MEKVGTISRQRGFTIVELLIVVVVIAILAAITIVAYNGISNRAKASAAQSMASQAARKIIAHSVQNDGDYPEAVTALAEAARAKVRLSTHINGDVYRVTSKRLYDEVLIPLVEDASSSG